MILWFWNEDGEHSFYDFEDAEFYGSSDGCWTDLSFINLHEDVEDIDEDIFWFDEDYGDVKNVSQIYGHLKEIEEEWDEEWNWHKQVTKGKRFTQWCIKGRIKNSNLLGKSFKCIGWRWSWRHEEAYGAWTNFILIQWRMLDECGDGDFYELLWFWRWRWGGQWKYKVEWHSYQLVYEYDITDEDIIQEFGDKETFKEKLASDDEDFDEAHEFIVEINIQWSVINGNIHKSREVTGRSCREDYNPRGRNLRWVN